MLVDFGKMNYPVQAHLAFITLDRYLVQTNDLPRPRYTTLYSILTPYLIKGVGLILGKIVHGETCL